jgi:hypothetical protein
MNEKYLIQTNLMPAGIVSLHPLSYTDRALFYFDFRTEVPDLCKLKLCASRAGEG